MGLVCTNLLQHFSSILKKDREEQLLTEFWEHGLRKHFLGAPFELIHHYLTLLTAPTYSLKSFLAAPLGSSILIAAVHRASILMGRESEKHVESLSTVLTSVAGKLSECKDLSNPIKAFNMHLPSSGSGSGDGNNLSERCLENLARLQKCSNSVQWKFFLNDVVLCLWKKIKKYENILCFEFALEWFPWLIYNSIWDILNC